MKVKVVVHEAEEGGFWAEVPSISGCATQGDSFEELFKNLSEAIEGYLLVSTLVLESAQLVYTCRFFTDSNEIVDIQTCY